MLNQIRRLWRSLAPQALRRFAGVATGRIIFEYAVHTLAHSKGSQGLGPPALVGFFSGASGVALSAQLASRALDQLGIAHRRIDVGDLAAPNDPGDRSASAWIFYLNPPELMYVMFRWGLASLHGPRFGYWAWELLRAPRSWRRAVRAMDAVMAPSSYTAKSFEPKHVTLTPHPLFVEHFNGLRQRKARRAEDPFLVVSLFDFTSSAARKNPFGALSAFKNAFADDPTTRLIFKTQNSDRAPELARALQQEAGPNVEFIDAVWDYACVIALISSADALLSLHRAEGFGLTLAEAMILGTPVVATGWSGNLDFMDDDTSCLVPVKLVAVDDPQSIYRGQSWAEPDVRAAANFLRNLRDKPDYAKAIAQRATTRIIPRLAPKAWLQTLPDNLKAAIAPRQWS